MNSAVSRRRLVLTGLWVTAAAAQWGALQPVLNGERDARVILYHVIGASFAVCGLLALYRRPDGRTGRLMVVTGFLLFARPLISRVDSSFAQTVAVAIGNREAGATGSGQPPRFDRRALANLQTNV